MRLHQQLSKADCNVDELLEYCVVHPESLSQASESDQSLPLHALCRNAVFLRNDVFVLRIIEVYPGALLVPNRFGFLPIHKALSVASEEHLPAIKILVASNPGCLSFKSLEGQTALHIAVDSPRNPSQTIISYLIEQNPQSVFIADKYGQLPIHKLAAKPRVSESIVLDIIRAGPSALSVADNRGFLPLHWLLCRSQPNIDLLFAFIEEFGEGLLETDLDGHTPFMRYALNKDKDPDLEDMIIGMTELMREQRRERLQELADESNNTTKKQAQQPHKRLSGGRHVSSSSKLIHTNSMQHSPSTRSSFSGSSSK